MVGTEVEAKVRRCIAGQHAALSSNGFSGEVVQRGIANPNDAEISGAPPSPVAEVVEIDIGNGSGDGIERVRRVVTRPSSPFSSAVGHRKMTVRFGPGFSERTARASSSTP